MSYLITCVDSKYGIGLNNTIPWRNTEEGKNDMKLFKNITEGNAIIMGYNTYKSIGQPLPNRINIVVSNTHYNYFDKGLKSLYVFKTLEEAVNFGLKYETNTNRKCFICGGEQIYNLYMLLYKPKIIYITELKDNWNCDTFFPYDMINKKIYKKNHYFYDMYTFSLI